MDHTKPIQLDNTYTNHGLDRSEEVQHIIERMPTKFGVWVSILVCSIVFFMALFASIISYPDVISGDIIVNTRQAPVKLISSSSGKIELLTHSTQSVSSGDYIAYLQNPARIEDVKSLKEHLKTFIPSEYFKNPNEDFPPNLTLGDITNKYFAFVSATQNVHNYVIENSLLKQRINLQDLLKQENLNLANIEQQLEYHRSNVQLNYKFFRRDSILSLTQAESESDFDKGKINYLSVLQSYNNSKQALTTIREKQEEIKGQIEQLDIKIRETDLQLKISLNETYNDLLDNIRSWEQRYVFIAPINGKVQFLKFWSNHQFVQPSDELFTLVPDQNKLIGQCIIPGVGAGKVKIGQEVTIQLEHYPYREFGAVKGVVSSISLTTSNTKTKDQGSTDNYLVQIALPNDLKTTYGTQLDFKYELKGIAEIITEKRKLGERLFDNVKTQN